MPCFKTTLTIYYKAAKSLLRSGVQISPGQAQHLSVHDRPDWLRKDWRLERWIRHLAERGGPWPLAKGERTCRYWCQSLQNSHGAKLKGSPRYAWINVKNNLERDQGQTGPIVKGSGEQLTWKLTKASWVWKTRWLTSPRLQCSEEPVAGRRTRPGSVRCGWRLNGFGLE